MALSLFKFISAVATCLVILVCGLAPIKSARFRSNQKYISLGNSFCGGLFLALSLLHLLPESQEELQSTDISDSSHVSHFPISFALCLATFTLILLIDRVAFKEGDANNNNRLIPVEMNEADPKISRQQNGHQDALFILESDNEEDEDSAGAQRKQSQRNRVKDTRNLKTQKNKVASLPTNQKLCNMTSLEEKLLQNKLIKFPTMPISGLDNKASGTNITLADQSRRSDSASSMQTIDARFSSPDNNARFRKRTLKRLMLVLIMGVHGFFNGLALGVCNTFSQLITLLIAILIHKFPEAIGVGVALVSSRLSETAAKRLIYLLAIFTPAGIVIGDFISGIGPVASGACKAISAGAVLYVAIMEIIVEEFSRENSTNGKFFAFCFGIMLIAGLELFE